MVIALGALLPDLIDKPIHLIGWSPYGRTVGHSLITLMVATGIFGLLRGHLRASSSLLLRGLGAGIILHLLGDALDDIEATWRFSGFTSGLWCAWPLATPDELSAQVARRSIICERCTTITEIATLALSLLFVARAGAGARRVGQFAAARSGPRAGGGGSSGGGCSTSDV